eukprot:comp17663_c0_seq1/m.17460 comp17663_c0_seq1/g.17460  ORF comp17663_c0_seq1/g.17460 comp17663_c0_seq1/m.17460 type:complete len:167 (-) comp17663_c0_seq1:343-843(-)
MVAMAESNKVTYKPELGDITKHNVKLLRLLNSHVFPVSYNDQFYTDVQEAGEFAKLAWYNDCMVGAVCCRQDKQPDGTKWVYIMTLGCLKAYRRLGIGSAMLQHIMEQAEKDPKITKVYLHVQVNNEEALEFYKKHNFEVTSLAEQYYKKIEPADAHVLEKTIYTC